MHYSTYRFTLDLRKHQSQMSIAVFKNDTAVRLIISLTDGGKPYYISEGTTAIFYGKRPDDEPLIHRCMIKDNTEIIYEFEGTTTLEDGVVNCEIRLYGLDNELITAPRFTIVVDERLVNDDDVDIPGVGSPISALDALFLSEKAREEAFEKMREWNHVITDAADFTTENLATMSGRVLVKGVSYYGVDLLRFTVPSSIKLIKFIDSSMWVNLYGTSSTEVNGFKGEIGGSFDVPASLIGFGKVKSCTGYVQCYGCKLVEDSIIAQAHNCENVMNVSCTAYFGDGAYSLFSNCTIVDNVTVTGDDDHPNNFGYAEFQDCKHVSNVHNLAPEQAKITYDNCLKVDGDTCDDYYTAEDNGKVQTVNTSGTKSLISVYTQEEIDTKLGDISTILTALHEGGIE